MGRAVFVLLLAYIAYHYARLTNFPIGDDPAVHIATVKSKSYMDILGLTYPLPLFIFKAAAQFSGIDYPLLFVQLISTFLFLSGLSLAYFLYATTRNWPLAVASALIFVGSRWANDGLRMGLLAESLSWAMLFLTLTFLSQRRVIATLIASLLLALSHPFSTLIFGLLFLLYAVYLAIRGNVRERRFIKWLAASYALIALSVSLIKPEIIARYISFNALESKAWGNRPFLEILTSDEPSRIIIPLLALIGLVAAIPHWKHASVKIAFFLAWLGLFFSLNYLFGIYFIPFRFYVYLEAAIAIFAGIAIACIVDAFTLPRWLSPIAALLIALVVSMPNFSVNEKIGRWQATKPDAHAVMLPDDRQALAWIKENTRPDGTFNALERYAIWLVAVADRPNIAVSSVPYDEKKLEADLANATPFNSDYIYYAIGQEVPKSIVQSYHQVYKQGDVSLWERDNVN